MSRFTSLIKAQKIPLLPTVVFVMIFLCQYAIVGLVWENTDCGLRPSNLLRRVSVREAEADNMFNGVPFGSINDEWESAKDEMSFLDVLWMYSDSGFLDGTDVYVVVRLGIPVACMVSTYY